MVGEDNSISFTELISDKLPQRLQQAIDETELTVEEVRKWQTYKPKFLLAVSDSRVIFETRISFQVTKKTILLGTVLFGTGYLIHTGSFSDLDKLKDAWAVIRLLL